MAEDRLPPPPVGLATGLVVTVGGTTYSVGIDPSFGNLRLGAIENVQGESISNQFAGVSGVNNHGGSGVYGSASAWDGVHGESQSSQHAGVSGTNTGGGSGIWAIGKPAGYFVGDVTVTGDIQLTNADCAEDFDIADTGVVGPGTVMVLGDEGKLQPSGSAYDKRVTGVISGAGNFKPGIVLDKQQKRTGRQPIALLGKVYCKVDARFGPVEIGDLLTTSPTPGHAMKATDQVKAFGAVIGKALRPLNDGQGLIPILIALQ